MNDRATSKGMRAPSVHTLADLVSVRGKSQRTWLISPRDPLRSDDASRLSFEDVYLESARIARAFQALGGTPGRVVALVAGNSPEFIFLLFGAWLAGLVPAPLHLPFFVARWEDYVERVRKVLVESDAQFLAVADDFAQLAASVGEGGWKSGTASSLRRLGDAAPALDSGACAISTEETALIQFSSGSTRLPLGVELSHQNLLSNVDAIGRAVCAEEEVDVALTWLPLFHDMGLTGTLLYSWYWGLHMVLMSPQDFIAAPASWLWAISRFRVTGCAAPNFAYALAADRRRVRDETLKGLDLSSWRAAFNGAELIQEGTVSAFAERFGRYGFREEAMYPAYGLAENVVACCLPPYGRSPRVDRVDRRLLETTGVAHTIQDEGSREVRGLVSVGLPVAGTALRITDEAGVLARERQVGAIQIRGRSTMKGYRGRAAESAAAFSDDGWLYTGDLGYVADGELFIVGRSKDVIKKAGAKYDAADIQSLVSQVDGVRAGGVAAFGIDSPDRGTQDLAVLAETRLGTREELRALEERVQRAVRGTFGTAVDLLEFLSPGSLKKTSSGKVRTGECKNAYLSGDLPRVWPPLEQ